MIPRDSVKNWPKIQKFHFWVKSSKIILTSIALIKTFILSCFTIFQPYLTYRTSQKKALWFWTCHSKSAIFGHIQCIPDLGWVIMRSSYKIFFSKSSHHPEHFSYLSFCFKMNTSEATGDWNLLKKRDFKLKFVQNFYFRVSGNDSSWKSGFGHLFQLMSLNDNI